MVPQHTQFGDLTMIPGTIPDLTSCKAFLFSNNDFFKSSWFASRTVKQFSCLLYGLIDITLIPCSINLSSKKPNRGAMAEITYLQSDANKSSNEDTSTPFNASGKSLSATHNSLP